MYADEYEYISEAADTLMRLSADDRVRQLCDARTEYYARERYNAHVQKEFAGMQKELEKTKGELVDKEAELERLREEIKKLKEK